MRGAISSPGAANSPRDAKVRGPDDGTGSCRNALELESMVSCGAALAGGSKVVVAPDGIGDAEGAARALIGAGALAPGEATVCGRSEMSPGDALPGVNRDSSSEGRPIPGLREDSGPDETGTSPPASKWRAFSKRRARTGCSSGLAKAEPGAPGPVKPRPSSAAGSTTEPTMRARRAGLLPLSEERSSSAGEIHRGDGVLPRLSPGGCVDTLSQVAAALFGFKQPEALDPMRFGHFRTIRGPLPAR